MYQFFCRGVFLLFTLFFLQVCIIQSNLLSFRQLTWTNSNIKQSIYLFLLIPLIPPHRWSLRKIILQNCNGWLLGTQVKRVLIIAYLWRYIEFGCLIRANLLKQVRVWNALGSSLMLSLHRFVNNRDIPLRLLHWRSCIGGLWALELWLFILDNPINLLISHFDHLYFLFVEFHHFFYVSGKLHLLLLISI